MSNFEIQAIYYEFGHIEKPTRQDTGRHRHPHQAKPQTDTTAHGPTTAGIGYRAG